MDETRHLLSSCRHAAHFAYVSHSMLSACDLKESGLRVTRNVKALDNATKADIILIVILIIIMIVLKMEKKWWSS